MEGCYGVFGWVFNRETPRNPLCAKKPRYQGRTDGTRT